MDAVSDCDHSMLNLSNPLEILLQDYVALLSTLTDKMIEIVPFDDWKQRVIDPLNETSPLYPLTLYFQDSPEKEILHFDTALAQSELSRHNIEYSGDYQKLLTGVFDKTLRVALGII